MNIKKLREWAGYTQVEFAEAVGMDQGGLSRIEKGDAKASQKLQSRIIDALTPTVLFLNEHEQSQTVASAMLHVNQIDTIESHPESFVAALRASKRIVVITDKPRKYGKLIDKAMAESGLENIPIQRLNFPIKSVTSG